MTPKIHNENDDDKANKCPKLDPNMLKTGHKHGPRHDQPIEGGGVGVQANAGEVIGEGVVCRMCKKEREEIACETTHTHASAENTIEEVLKNGENGLLVNPGDAVDLAEKIMFLISNPDKSFSMGEDGYKKTVARNDPDKYAEEVMSIYDELFSRNN